MKWTGDIEDLAKYGVDKEPNTWCIKFQGNRIQVTKQVLYKTAKIAERYLHEHIWSNFCQGHYWHKGSNNTFEQEGGWSRNNNQNISISRREFKKMAKELTAELLREKVFTIEQI